MPSSKSKSRVRLAFHPSQEFNVFWRAVANGRNVYLRKSNRRMRTVTLGTYHRKQRTVSGQNLYYSYFVLMPSTHVPFDLVFCNASSGPLRSSFHHQNNSHIWSKLQHVVVINPYDDDE